MESIFFQKEQLFLLFYKAEQFVEKRLEIVRKNNFQDRNLEMESDDRVPQTQIPAEAR